MRQLEMKAYFGDNIKNLTVTQPSGAGGGYQIFLDKFYQGTLFKRGAEGVHGLNKPIDFTSEDIMILIDLIESHFID